MFWIFLISFIIAFLLTCYEKDKKQKKNSNDVDNKCLYCHEIICYYENLKPNFSNSEKKFKKICCEYIFDKLNYGITNGYKNKKKFWYKMQNCLFCRCQLINNYRNKKGKQNNIICQVKFPNNQFSKIFYCCDACFLRMKKIYHNSTVYQHLYILLRNKYLIDKHLLKEKQIFDSKYFAIKKIVFNQSTDRFVVQHIYI